MVAWQAMRRSPLAAGLAVVTLAIGVGAAIAVFMVVQGVVLRDLPYPESDRLVLIWRGTAEDPSRRGALSPPDLIDVRDRTTALAAVAGINSFSTTFVPDAGDPEQIQLGAVAGPFFRLIGLRPALGGTREADEAGPISTRDPDVVSVIVLSHDFWVRPLGADPNTVGRTLRFGGSRMRVVSVMSEDFALHMPVDAGMSTDLSGWTPLGIDPATASRDGAYLKVWGRLNAGATIGEAQAQLDGAAAQLREAHRTHAESGFRLRAVPLERDVIAHASGVLLLLGLDPGFIPKSRAIGMSLGVAAAAGAMAAFGTLVSGVIPALMISRGSLSHGVRSRATSTTASRRVRRVAVGVPGRGRAAARIRQRDARADGVALAAGRLRVPPGRCADVRDEPAVRVVPRSRLMGAVLGRAPAARRGARCGCRGLRIRSADGR